MTSVDDEYHMAHIPEEDESSEEGSINPHSMFRHDHDEDDNFEEDNGSLYHEGEDDEDDDDEEFDEPTPLEYPWSHHMTPEDGSEVTSYSGDFNLSGLSIEEGQNIIFEGIKDADYGDDEDDDDDEESNHSSVLTSTSSRRGSFYAPPSRPHSQSMARFSFSSVQSFSSRHSAHSAHGSSGSDQMQGSGAAKRRTISITSQQKQAQQQRHHQHIQQQLSTETFDDELLFSNNSSSSKVGRNFSRRRPSISLRMNPASAGSKPGSSGSVSSHAPETVLEDQESSSSPSLKDRFIRKSIPRASLSTTVSFTAGHKPSGSGVAGVFDSVDSAISSLGQGGNSEWENVAAAAAVVAAVEGGAGKRSHVQFTVDQKVLVVLNILNHSNLTDPKDALTVNPVNKYGFPPGEGKHGYEQKGPYGYILATVRKVHFDEDVRYYTVAREDTGTEQRADTAFMEPIRSATAIEAARRAAHQTSRWVTDKDIHPKDETNTFSEFVLNILSWPVGFFRKKVRPFYKKTRAKAKKHVAMMLYGESPYTCKLRATGINLLALCSIVYLFLEVISLAFFPARTDVAVGVIGVIVWSILALELILEWLIRPVDYAELISSDRAYAPSTARNINAYHLIFETISLALYIPEIVCLHSKTCSNNMPLSGLSASLMAVLGRSRWQAVFGRFWIGLRTIRIFGLVRHCRKMWINNTFRDENKKIGILRAFFLLDFDEENNPNRPVPFRKRKSKVKVEDEHTATEDTTASDKANRSTEEDQRLKTAATIGTALMVVNSHRALFILVVIVTILPMIKCIRGVNRVAEDMTDLLQSNNVVWHSKNDTSCEYLEAAFDSWIRSVAIVHPVSPTETVDTYLLWAQVEPVTCAFLQDTGGVITVCSDELRGAWGSCDIWDDNPTDADAAYFAHKLGLREGGITEISRETTLVVDRHNLFGVGQTSASSVKFKVRVLFNQNHTVSLVNFSSVLFLSCALVLCLFGLTKLREDAGRLVLDPLQRMLKIIVLYAENPLSQTAVRKARKRKGRDKEDGEDGNASDGDKEGDKQELGNYETEQLINAISKIADLLRKCWGVAGAGIISSNLARTQDGKTVVFNPTVPGKRVYALFGFVAINGFSAQLRALDRDVMILINDVAKVVHDEVYRWSLGDSGQCNKNLGAAFLMVFRIGDFTEVHEKQARATDVVFSSHDKSRKTTVTRRKPKGIRHGRHDTRGKIRRPQSGRGQDTLQLASLPGIQSFSDRALLGMLKSFAGIHRDRNLQDWKKDFRLGAGVGAFTVNIIIGMDAGWAVEGAVGSEYKIDATYLSPHVNMASRMMSASKQYGVTILLSQAVEELLSQPARSKLRHLDTVYVKGSSVAQRIFTYDARHKGVDFFLFERSPEQADVDADSYSPTIWENDQDLRAMRQHVTELFKKTFNEGKDKYLEGEWSEAIEKLKKADDIMITTVLEEGYLDYNPDDPVDERIFDRNNQSEEIVRIRNELGDGACKCLIAYMMRTDGVPPPGWKGVRPLTSK